jgi:SAM-dependent methyltransferase
MSGEALEFHERFEAVFSNAALHWMKDPEAVIRGVWRALVPGGRFVGEFGGYGNIAAILEALEAALSRRGREIERPWYFPRPEEYADLLAAEGFIVQEIERFPRPTRLPGALAAWLETFAQVYSNALPEADRLDYLAEVEKELRPTLCGADGIWFADYVRLRFAAVKPAD